MKRIFIYLRKNKSIEKFYKESAFLQTPLGLSFINFIFQRIFRINAGMTIPVNFTSRVIAGNFISYNNDKDTLLSFAVSSGAYIQALNGIKLGRNFLFAPGVKIISANHDYIERHKSIIEESIVIGDNVWLGANVVILPGVRIGNNCIIGAGSVVSKSFIQEGLIIAGNPAKIIGNIPL